MKCQQTLMSIKINALWFVYILFALFLAPSSIPSFDTFYYWDWSRHLAWSYYDGSPMIAYFIKGSTLLFGDTLFALNLVGIVVTVLTSVILYRTARFFLNKEASGVAMLLWLFSPLVTLDLLKETTYDVPLTLFWALTLYYVINYIKSNQPTAIEPKGLYKVGLMIGLMLLSKYSGVVLVWSLLVFLVFTPYRVLFKSYHLYLSMMLALLLFMPVIVWNAQHEWVSFLYQLQSHQVSQQGHWWFNIANAWFKTILPALNFLLVPLIFCWIKRTDKNNRALLFCMIVCTVYLGFYMIVGVHAVLRVSWMALYLITAALLGGYCFQAFHYRKTVWLLIVIYGVSSVGILMSRHPWFSWSTSKKTAYVHLMETFNTIYPAPSVPIITSDWEAARLLFFIQTKPPLYTLDCGAPQNQYALWSAKILRGIQDKTIKEALYMDTVNRGACIRAYFDACEQQPTITYNHKEQDDYALYVYRCFND